MLAQMGIELYKLQLLARWESDTVLRYIAEAFLKSITADFRRLEAGRSLDAAFKLLAHSVYSLELKVGQTDEHTREELHKEAILRADMQSQIVTSLRAPKFIQNNTSKSVHFALCTGMEMHPSLWRTKCGWKFAGAPFARSRTIPASAPFCD